MGFGNEGVSGKRRVRTFVAAVSAAAFLFAGALFAAATEAQDFSAQPGLVILPESSLLALKNAREQADKSPVDKLAAQNAAASGAKALTAGGKSADSDTAAGDEAVDDNAIAVPFFSKPMRIGVQLDFVSYNNGAAYRKTREQLQGVFGDRNVEFVSLNVEQLVNAITDNEVDFLILDAGFYTRYETTNGLKAVASVWPLSSADPSVGAGSLFITRSDDDSIASPKDLGGKTIAAYYPTSFTGYLVGLRDLYQRGVVIESLTDKVVFLGADPERIAQAVMSGRVDAAILPACEFERMVNKEHFDRSRFHLLGLRDSGLKQCAHSTELYPSFYFAALPETSQVLRKSVGTALFTMNTGIEAVDWSLPASNRAVHDLLFDLKVGPYANLAAWRLSTFAKEQSTTVMIFLGVCFLIIFYAGSLSVLVRRRTKLLAQAVADRDRIEREAAASRDHIANLERTGIVGQMSTMIAHELKQPLGAITNFANGLLRRCCRGQIDPKVLTEVLEEIVEQGTRASEIVNRVRAYAKHQNPKLTMEDMSVSVDRAIETFVRSRRTTAPVVRQIIPYLWADIDGWEIELAVLNILKNAADAIEGVEDGEIHVEVKPEDRYWRIEVTDNGPKVTQEDVDRFMMPLVTTKENGLGLGISIVANIAERHHGRLIGIANPERGVTICLDIPRAVMPEHTAI